MRTFEQYLYSMWQESALPIDDLEPDAPLPNPRQPTPTMRLAPQQYTPLQPPPERKLLTKKMIGKKRVGESPKKIAKRLERVPGGSVEAGTFTPTRNRAIPRREMPQLKNREEFIHWLQSVGVGVQIKEIAPRDLIRNPVNKEKLTAHAQSQIYVQKAMKFIRQNTLLKKLIVLSSDGVIFDGNHHWYALMAYKQIRKTPVPMYVVDMPFDELKQFTIQNCPNVTFEEQWNEWIGDYAYDMIFEDSPEFWTEE